MSGAPDDMANGGSPIDGELFDLASSLAEGSLDEQGTQRINELLEQSGANRAAYLQLMHVIAGLEWQGPRGMAPANLAPKTKSEPSQPSSLESASTASSGATEMSFARGQLGMLHRDRSRPSEVVRRQRSYLGARTLIAAALAGVAFGSFATWQLTRHAERGDIARNQQPLPRAESSADADGYVATLVNVANCRWDTVRSTAELHMGSALRPGDSLHLLEGVAQVQVFASGEATMLQLEGPAAVTLTRDGLPSLLYGKLTASFSSNADQFALDTPLGRVSVSGNASIGVSAAPNHVELHVFSGTATLELWSTGLDSASEQLTATSGDSLRATVDKSGHFTFDRGAARQNWFVTPQAISESRLHISERYVELVHAAKPVAYWRFERCDDAMMINDMGSRLSCRMIGDAVRWHPTQDGGAVEFGATAGPGYLISDDTLDGLISDSYSLELWAKPSYYHHGALFSMIQWTPSRSPLGSHRMHLELCGPVSGFPVPYRPNETNPGRIRFIQQCKSNYDVECYSAAPYAVRKWQHIAAVKEAGVMRLYVNGELVDAKEAKGELEGGLRVLMGQLFPISPKVRDEVTSRLYGGELDEVALYNRALTADELREHVELALHEKQEPAAASDQLQ